jgi:glycosyltransferase involved in cell wall biosynthesis
MISVLTLTYQRPNLLEEAIHSFLIQNQEDCEMVVINDSEKSKLTFNHPQVKVINVPKRFTSISKKLEWGFTQCKNEFIYRLDDDDLLSPNGLKIAKDFIVNNPKYDIYRSSKNIFFVHNKFENLGSNVNNGNIYTKSYLNRIDFGDKSFGEDFDITFKRGAKIYEDKGKPTMIYRWGMNTYHISGLGDVSTTHMYEVIDSMTKKNLGDYVLNPKFNDDYYRNINYI